MPCFAIIPLSKPKPLFYRVDYHSMSLKGGGEYEAWEVLILEADGSLFAHHIESTPDNAWSRICGFDAAAWGAV